VVPALEFEFNGHKFYDDLVYYIPITDDHALDSLHPGCLKSSVMHTGTRKIARRRYTSRFQREGERAKRNGEMRRTGRRKKTRMAQYIHDRKRAAAAAAAAEEEQEEEQEKEEQKVEEDEEGEEEEEEIKEEMRSRRVRDGRRYGKEKDLEETRVRE